MLTNNCNCNNNYNQYYVHSYSCMYAIKCIDCYMRLDLGFIQPHLHMCYFSYGQEQNFNINYNLIYNTISKEKDKKEEYQP